MVRFIFIDLDIKEYISSGIIESYVLGVVSDQERREVECMSHIYPELQEHLLAVQQNLEQLSEGWKKEPPAELKGKVMAAIHAEAIAEKNGQANNQSAKVINMPTPTSPEKSNGLKWLAAASVILFVGAAGLFLMRTNQFNDVQQTLSAKEKALNEKEDLLADLQSELGVYNEEREFLTNDNTVAIALAGTPVSPDAKVKVYWNQDENKMMLAGMNLPETPTEKQYQLWAIVDGTPVDLGVLDMDGNPKAISREANLKNVQAFAITLEKKGGSPTPNLDQLYVIGNVGA
ncbi:MAG: anti-sigma factor [Bacteroidota bacterium]